MATYLAPIEKPRSLLLKLAYFFMRRMFGKVSTPIAVFSARMPTAFLTYYGKVSRLDNKLKLPKPTAVLVRERVASINGCLFCLDATRFYATKKSPDVLPKLDALADYKTSPLFSDAERAALDYVSELVQHRTVSPGTFAELSRHYSEREICDIVWLVASEHLYNMTNIGLGIGSDGMCEARSPRDATAAAQSS
ncbi:MAG: carboxymuconolactone decarboxylase family protein [Actinobacteria bacterium]|nr:carboxymuconolactone decarboxylase family protein [Actinomycetota bacterium]